MELIGVDIGGSNLRAGRVVNGSIEENFRLPVDRDSTSGKVTSDLFTCIDKVITKNTQSIGVGVPAVVDPVAGIAYDVQNIPAWEKIELKNLMEQRYKVPVYINNDANCFAIGEKIFGKGKGCKNFIGLSLGTGVGMGIIINEELYNGVLCGAGEIGMTTYRESIVEDYVGSFFFTRRFGKTSKELFHAAHKGDSLALYAFREYGTHLGETIKNILYAYAPEIVILGGSISTAFPFFKDSVEASLQTFAYQKQIENFKIETSNKSASPVLGAAALCF